MTETTIPQVKAEWPPTVPRRERGRRESKVAYRNSPSYSTPKARDLQTTYPSSPDHATPRAAEQFYMQQQQSAQSVTLSYRNVQHPGGEDSNSRTVVQQQSPVEGMWYSQHYPYTLSPNSPVSPRSFGSPIDQSLQNAFSQMLNNGQEIPWNGFSPSLEGSELDDMPGSEMNYGSFGSLDSMGVASENTTPSSISGDFVFPTIETGFESATGTAQMNDLTLPQEWFEAASVSGYASSPCTMNANSPYLDQQLTFDLDYNTVTVSAPDIAYGNLYAMTGAQESSSTLVGHGLVQNQDIGMFGPPWNSQLAQNSVFQVNANAGVVGFEPPRGTPYQTFIQREQFLDTGQQVSKFLGPEAVSPGVESESESWVVASYPSSDAASAVSGGSPQSHNSPISQSPSPSRRGSDDTHHPHILNSLLRMGGIHKPKLPRGRQRGLTALEKKQARDVREAKACWACHISKTKCSPCSPGKPCEQCARLAGKRRFCLFDCFNDPLESLNVFLVPEYLMGHLTQANVEAFMSRNAVQWGSQTMSIRLNWGYRKYLSADVVALALHSDSEMRYDYQTIFDESGNRVLITNESPPIGIPLAAMEDMQEEYLRYVQEIVQTDIQGYIPAGYWQLNSLKLPVRLLQAICSFYRAGRESSNDVDLLGRALEMHVTMTILERSLCLDGDSLNRVQNHLHRAFPEECAPRCVQRQVKLAFFLMQQKRIMCVLKDWGAMMWATNNNPNKDQEWAVAFCVFVVLILVMDKTLRAASGFCEGQIKNHGFEEKSEREKFEGLVRLTEKELFERCKEIFHWKFKTRKGGKEACNPIRDGKDAFHKSRTLDNSVEILVGDLQAVVGDFEHEVHSSRSPRDRTSAYTTGGRLVCIFLDDFVNR